MPSVRLDEMTRVAVVGAGGVGVNCAAAILQQGLCTELVLYDRRPDRARGEALDFLHGAPLLPECRVDGRSFEEFEAPDILVLAAGVHTAPGQTRLDLIDVNLEIAAEAAAAIERGGLPRVAIVVTSPLDVVTEYLTRRWEGRDVSVLGSGTSLDSWRLMERLAEELGVHPGNVHAWVVGEHGDSAVFLFSSAMIGPFSLKEYAERHGGTLAADVLAGVEDDVRTAAYRVRELKGSATHSIGLATARIVLHLTREPGFMIPVSTRVDEGLCASLPAILGPGGPSEAIRRRWTSGSAPRGSGASTCSGRRASESRLADAARTPAAQLRAARAKSHPYASPVAQIEPTVYLISGPMAAGKSTVARLLASRFERGVHLEGDVFRRSIVSGRAEMTPAASAEALEQLRLRYRIGAAAADAYFEAGFTVALEDVVAGPLLGEYRTMIRSRPCHVIVLLPSLEAVVARESERRAVGYTHWAADDLYEGFAAGTPRVGLWLDSTELSPEQTVDAILAGTTSSRSPLVVVDYDQAWPAAFEELAGPVRRALADIAAAVEHIGSTAVPGLAAKPIVDIDVVVRSVADVPLAIERLRGLGYVYQGDKGIAGREAFLWPPRAVPHHLYVVVAGSRPHVDHVAFRDYLRAHPAQAAEYASLKRTLADRHGQDRLRYTEAKSDFVVATLRTARPG